jgi:hypothetical protein
MTRAFGVNEAYGIAARACTTSSATAVHEFRRRTRQVKVHHGVEGLYVNSTSRDICCDEDRYFAILEVLETLVSRALGKVAVEPDRNGAGGP